LLQEVVDLTKERFALYHAHIYLLDDHGEILNLVVGAGEVGHKMVEQGWSIRLSAEHSLVARTARMHAGTIVNNVTNEPDFFPNPLLPDTRAELAVPLIAGNHLLGVLDVQSDVLNHFTSEDLRIQTILAGQVAVALQNANQFQETQAALAITESLYQVTQFFSSADTVEELHQVAADNISHTLAADRVTVCTIDLEANKVMGYALEGSGANRTVEPNRAIIFQEVQTGLAGLAIRNQETIISPRGEPDARESTEAQLARTEYDAASVVVVPIRLRGDQAGVITISNRADQPDFRQDDIFFVENVANQLAITIENRSLLAGTRVALSETEALYRVSQALAQMDDEQTMFEFVLSEYLRVIGLTQGGVLIFDDENSEDSTLKALMVEGKLVEAGLQVKMKGNLASEKVMRTKKPVVITDALTDPLLEPTRDFTLEMEYKSLLLVPIVVRGQVFGILGADSLETIHEFTDREIAFVQNMADQLGIALENRRLLAETQVALAEVETTQQRYTVRAWEDYRNRRGGQRYEQVIEGVKPVGDKLPGEIIRVVENKQPMVFVGNSPELTEVDTRPLEPEAKSSLVVPLTVRNEIVGVLGLQETDTARIWTDEEVALVVTVAEQMSQAAESLRLLDESQQRAARELRVNEIGEKIRSAVSLDEALQIAVKEVGLSLKSPQTTVQLKMK
jgi:GAF domain-containing protein